MPFQSDAWIRQAVGAALGVTLAWGWLAGAVAVAGEATHDEPFVIERLATSHRFEKDGRGESIEERRVRVQSQAGVQQLGQVLAAYLDGRESLHLESVRIESQDGTVWEGGADLAQDLPAPATMAFPSYSDIRILSVTLPALSVGDILQYRLVKTLLEPDAPGQFWVEHRFEKTRIVLEEVLSVDVPAAVTPLVHAADGLEVSVETRDGRKVYRWHSAHLERAADEPSTLQEMIETAVGPADIEMSSFSSWAEMGSWYQTLIEDRGLPSARLRAKATELLEGIEGDSSRIAALYDYVSQQFRYFAVLLGMGRYQPRRPDETLDNGYGDCKDKAILLTALLRAAGYSVNPVLISGTRESVGEVPSPTEFDHMITAVSLPDRTLWLDSTSQVAPFGFLPLQLRGKQGLVIPESGKAFLEETPTTVPFPLVETIRVEGDLGLAGHLAARLVIETRGDAEFELRSAMLVLPQPLWRSLAEKIVRKLKFSGEVTYVDASEATDLEQPMRITYEVGSEDLLKGTDRDRKLSPILLGVTLQDPEEGEDGEDGDEATVELGTPRLLRAEFALQLPAEVEVQAPAGVEIDRDYLRYRSSYTAEGGALRAVREIEVLQEEIPPAKLREYRALLETTKADAKQVFRLRWPEDPGVETAASTTDPDRLFKLGKAALDADDPGGASSLFTRLVELDPEHPDAWHQLGRALNKLDRYQDAVDAFLHQLELDPFHSEANSHMAWALDKMEDPESAIAAYRKQLELYPLDDYATNELGRLLAENGACGEALEMLARAVSLDPDDCGARTRLGRCQLESGAVDEGLRSLRTLAETCDSPAWLSSAASSSLDLDQPEAALDLAERLLALDPGFKRGQQLRGRTLHKLGRYQDAADAFRHQLEIDPSSSTTNNHLGRSLERLEDPEGAAAAYRRALEIEPLQTYATRSLGRLLYKEERCGEAIPFLTRSLSNDPGACVTQAQLGICQLYVGVTDAAIESLEALAATCTNAPWLVAAAEFALGQHQPETAVLLLDQAVRIDPQPNAYARLSLALLQLRRFDEALAAAERQLELDPESQTAMLNIGMAYAYKGRLEEAAVALRRGSEDGPHRAKGLSKLSQVLFQDGKLGEAREAAQTALDLDQDLPAAHLTLGLILVREEATEEAIRHLEAARALMPPEQFYVQDVLDYLHRQAAVEAGKS